MLLFPDVVSVLTLRRSHDEDTPDPRLLGVHSFTHKHTRVGVRLFIPLVAGCGKDHKS